MPPPPRKVSVVLPLVATESAEVPAKKATLPPLAFMSTAATLATTVLDPADCVTVAPPSA